MPTSELTLLLFVAHLAQNHLSYSTIRVYLSAIRHLHLTAGLLNTFSAQSTPCLTLVLQGIKRYQACTTSPTICLPITIQIMHNIKATLVQSPMEYQNIMMWAACCVAFFGCLRCGEFTVPSQSNYDPTIHLSYHDVLVDSKASPSMVIIHIKQSKTDTTRKGTHIVLGLTGKEVCPVKAILPYLVCRGSKPGPLFVTADNHYLTQPLFRSKLHSLLAQIGLSADQFNTHSFQIGAATTADAAGLSEVQIKALGRWKSSTYQQYIRPSLSQLANLSKKLATEDNTQLTTS